jgi:hypothetical protein
MIHIDEKLARKIFDKARYYAYMGTSTICYGTSSLNVQKALRSKLPRSKMQYIGMAVVMSLAGTASSDKAEQLKKTIEEKE